MSDVEGPGLGDVGDGDGNADLLFLPTVFAKIKVFESAFDMDIQFLMNVSAKFIFWD